MSNLPPPSIAPQKGSANGKYLGITVLLLAGIAGAGFYIWKTQDEAARAAAKPIALPSASAIPTIDHNTDDNMPPPPPVAEEPVDAGKTAAPTKTATSASSAGGCETKCSLSNSTPELEGALAIRGSLARRCYNEALARDSSLQGRMELDIKIAGNGSICSVNATAKDSALTPLVACVANKVRAPGAFPATKGGCVEANIPLNFVPQGQK